MGYWKQLKIKRCEGWSVSLHAFYDGGHPRKFHVTLHEEGKRRRSFFFVLRLPAEHCFDTLSLSPANAPLQDRNLQSCMETAREILKSPSATSPTTRTLTLALAMDALLGARNQYRAVVSQLLRSKDTIPEQEGDFLSWVSECLTLLRISNQGQMTSTTWKKRTMTFRCALKRIAMFPEFWGITRAAMAQAALVRVSEYRKAESKKTLPQEHHNPLGVLEIRKLLGEMTLPQQVWFIKSLACGLRPSEVLRLSPEHIRDGKVDLQRVITKTKVNRRAPASLALRLCLQLEGRFPAPSEKELRELTRLHRFSRYATRTTFAVHGVYSGLDVVSVATYLGHASSQMVTQVYANQRPPGAGDDREAYYGNVNLKHKGVLIGEREMLWHRWLLRILVETMAANQEIGLVETQRLVGELVMGKEMHQNAAGQDFDL